MSTHEETVHKVGDWLADGWDWDGIGAALGLSADEAYQQYGEGAADYIRAKEGLAPGDDL